MAARNSYCVRRVPEEWSEWIELLTPVLDSRCAWRLPIVLAGLLLARGRRTVTTWLRAQNRTKEQNKGDGSQLSLSRTPNSLPHYSPFIPQTGVQRRTAWCAS